MARITVVCPDLPFPAHSGGNIKTYFLLEHLCSLHDVSLVTVLKGDSAANVEALRDALPLREIVSTQVDRGRSVGNFVRSLVQRRTLNEYRTYSPDLGPKAAPLFHAADCILVDHLEVMQYVPRRFWDKTLFHTHNAEHQLWLRKAQVTESLTERLGARIEGRRVAAREKRYSNAVAGVLAAPGDEAALKTIGATEATFHRTYHLGDDSMLDLPDVQWEDTEPLVFFLGTLSWEPNIDGLEWFVSEVWPLVQTQDPTARLVIGGNEPPSSLTDRAANDGTISVVGFVTEPEEYFSRARVVIAPLRFGSGMKLKVLDALMRGIPAVTTPIGVESIDALDGEHIIVAESPAAMATGVVRLLNDQMLWEAIRDASRSLARERYTWDIVRADLDAALSTVLGPKPGR